MAVGSEMTSVSPPPGVSSSSRVPAMASISPRESASPRPSPAVLRVPEPLEGQEDPVPVGHRDAGAGVDDPQLDAVTDGDGAAAAAGRRRSAGRWPPR